MDIPERRSTEVASGSFAGDNGRQSDKKGLEGTRELFEEMTLTEEGGAGAAKTTATISPTSSRDVRPKERMSVNAEVDPSSRGNLPGADQVDAVIAFHDRNLDATRPKRTDVARMNAQSFVNQTEHNAQSVTMNPKNIECSNVLNVGAYHKGNVFRGPVNVYGKEAMAVMADAPDVTDSNMEPTTEMYHEYRSLHDSNRKITTDDIQDIYMKLGDHWKHLAKILGIEESDIQAIRYENRDDLSEMAYQMLLQWLERESDKATVSVLTKAIFKLEGMDNTWKGKLLDRLDA